MAPPKPQRRKPRERVQEGWHPHGTGGRRGRGLARTRAGPLKACIHPRAHKTSRHIKRPKIENIQRHIHAHPPWRRAPAQKHPCRRPPSMGSREGGRERRLERRRGSFEGPENVAKASDHLLRARRPQKKMKLTQGAALQGVAGAGEITPGKEQPTAHPVDRVADEAHVERGGR